MNVKRKIRRSNIRSLSMRPQMINEEVWYYENPKTLSFYINDGGVEYSFNVKWRTLMRSLKRTFPKY